MKKYNMILLRTILVLSVCTLSGCKPFNDNANEEISNEINNVSNEKVNDNENNNANEELLKMNENDLTMSVGVNFQIKLGMTEEEVKRILGEPKSIEDTRKDKSAFEGKGSLYGDYVAYTYDFCNLSFYTIDETNEFKLGEIYSTSDKVSFSRRIKLGMSREDILSKYYKSDINKDVTYGGTEVAGKFIYGDYLNYEFDTVELNDKYEVAFENYSMKEYDGSTILSYEIFNEDGRITSASKCTEILYTIDKNNTLTSVRCSIYPKLA